MLKISGNIESIRSVEDTIRQTKHYEESVLTPDYPIQGQDFATRAFTKIMVVPIDPMKVKIDKRVLREFMRAEVLDAKKVITGREIKITFWYDYRKDEANLKVDPEEVVTLCDIVKGFKEAIANVQTKGMPSVPQESRNSAEIESL